MAYRIVKWIMAAAAVLYPALVLLAPGLAGLRGSIVAWMFYAAYVLATVMVWSLSKAGRPLGKDIDKDQVNREAKLTRDLQRKWIWMPRD